MSEIIDFTPCAQNKFKGYGGANGNKVNIIYEDESYMLKFSPPAKNKEMSYTNSCVSEYIACHILGSIGFLVQETLLGVYRKSEKEYIVVACKDFTSSGKSLMEFAQLKNMCINSDNEGYSTELETILTSFDEQKLLPKEELSSFFWDLFIADALVGNFDRHNGNWGLLIDEKNKKAEIAPVYDCGSCLYPQLDEKLMMSVMNDPAELHNRIFVYPTSAIKVGGSKINYFDYISSHVNPDCSQALERVSARMDMDKIYKAIDETPLISEAQKAFYKMVVSERKSRIIDYSLGKLL